MSLTKCRSVILVVAATTLAQGSLAAQAKRATTPRTTARALVTRTPAPVPMAHGPFDTTVFAGLKWREIGPFRGGRSVAAAGSASRPYEYWWGTTGGGVYKTTDGGHTWTPMTDKYFGGTIGAIGVSESNPDIVYVGGGEFPIRGNVSHGDGVWKTTDGGKTWKSLGLTNTRQISRVKVHPRDPNIVYVGAQGHVWGASPERGVYKSTDGGSTWRRVLAPRNDSSGVTDLVMDPTNPDVLYAAMWEAYRKPWQLVSGGEGSGIYKSTDAGEHWTELTRNPGLPSGVLGNIGITVSQAKPSRVWALIEADSGGVYRSDDAGATWRKVNSERKLRQRAWYYTKIFADPKDTNTVYVLNVGFHKSTDGGRTYRSIGVPHGDNHDLWIAPNDPQRMIEANDGGATVTVNGGKTWTDEDVASAQFYHVITTNEFPYKVCGAQQDNSTLCGPSRAPGGIDISEWKDAGGGESGYIAARWDRPNIIFAGSYGGYTTRKDMETGIERDVNPWPDNPMGHSAEDLKYRFQWTFPIVVSPHDANTLYIGSNFLHKSTNEGQTFTTISPDLTRHDPATLGASGGPLTKDQTSVEYYATIFTIAESPVTPGVIWTGSDDGIVQLTRDGGKTWKNVSPPWPEWTRASMIEASKWGSGTAYVAGNRYQLDDMQPYLYRTNDFGATWTRIDAGIAREEFTRVVREDEVRRGLLYAGTERGVWASFDDGDHWQPLKLNLPPVPVHDLAVKDGDLVAATHGRSFWILDDLSALRQLTDETTASGAKLFRPRDPYRVQWGGGFGGGGGGGSHPVGSNPPGGAIVYYWLKDKFPQVTLDFLDANGALIRSFTSAQDSASRADSLRSDSTKKARTDSLTRAGITADSIKKLEARTGEETSPAFDEESFLRAPRPPRVPNKQGMNQFAWNLRYPDARGFTGMILWGAGVTGPVAPPGTYSVRMRVNGQLIATEKFEVKKDPRTPATLADLREQFTLVRRIQDRFSQANDAVRTIRNIRTQIAQRRVRLSAADQARLDAASGSMMSTLEQIENELYQTKNRSSQDPLNYPIKLNNRIGALGGVVAGTEAKPTKQSYDVYEQLSALIQAQLTQMTQTIASDLPKVNAVLTSAGQGAIVPSTAELTMPTTPVAATR